MNNILNNKTVENRYRHYKGDIYYKLAEPFVINAYNEEIMGFKVVKEIDATFETTGEKLTVCITDTGIIFFTFDNRPATKEEHKGNYVLYQSEESGLYWVRFKNEWEGFNEQGIKRFTLVNA